MLVYNKDYKNLTKIFITNSQYSIGELSTHGSLSMLALNPNSLNLLKQSFYEKVISIIKRFMEAFTKFLLCWDNIGLYLNFRAFWMFYT